MDFYPRFIDDYRKDTNTLTLEEHGAYALLLDHYYSTQKPIENQHRIWFKICAASSARERKAVCSIIERFFVLESDGLHNKKADQVISERIDYIEKKSVAGRVGASARWDSSRNANANAVAIPNDTENNASANGKRIFLPSKNDGKPIASSSLQPQEGIQNGSSLTVKSGEANARNSSVSRARASQNNDQTKDSEVERFANWQRFRASYPKGVYPQADFVIAEKLGNQRLDEGATWQEFFDGVDRFKAQQDALGNTGSRWVKSPKDFFDHITRKWLEPFPLPEDTGRSSSNGVHKKKITWKPKGPDDGAPDVAE